MGTMVTEAASAIWKGTSDNTAKGSSGAIKMVTADGGSSAPEMQALTEFVYQSWVRFNQDILAISPSLTVMVCSYLCKSSPPPSNLPANSDIGSIGQVNRIG